MSLLVNLDTKSKKSPALQEVRESASTNYKALEEKYDKLNKNCALLKSKNIGSVSFPQRGPAEEHATTSQWESPTPQHKT